MNRLSYWGTRTTFENAWRTDFLTLVPTSVGDSTHPRRLFIYIFILIDSMVTITILRQWLNQKPLLLCLEISSVKTIHNFRLLQKSEEHSYCNKLTEYSNSNSNSSRDCRKKLFKDVPVIVKVKLCFPTLIHRRCSC